MRFTLPKTLHIAVLAAILFISCVLSYAQVQAGRIVGTVFDPNRAVIPGAAVVVTNTATNVAVRVTSNEIGDYVVIPLNPGVYSVSATAQGFQTAVRGGVELQVGQDLRIDMNLQIGEMAEVVRVTAEVPIITTESGAVGHVMANHQITDLPLNGRSFAELARLTPGVVMLSGTGNVNRIRPENVNGTTISGVRGNQVSFYIDGVDTAEQHQGGTYIQTSIDALQEFSLQQNAYSAEHSRSGSFFNVTTKSGSNEWHGTLFEFLRNEKLDSRNFFASRREVLKRNQFGGGIGGPVILPKLYNGRNRTFFFVAHEGMRERQGDVINRIAPTNAMLAGNFSAPGTNRVYDPLTTTTAPITRQQFPGNIIPASRLSPQAAFFNKYIPVANNAEGTFRFSPSRALDTDQVNVRIDQNLSDKHKLFGRFSYFDNRLVDPNDSPLLGNANMGTHGSNVALSLTSNIRPTMVHEVRANLLKGIIDLQPFLPGVDFNRESGVRGFEQTKRSYDVGSFPDFLWTGYASVRGSSFDQRPKTQDRDTYEILDNVTWIKRRHLLKFGGKMRYYRWLGTDSKSYMGTWNFNGQNTENPASLPNTGHPFADWVLGLPTSATRGFPSDTFGGWYWAWHFFFQDDIKVSRNFTLNIGLRYEYTPWTTPYRGQTGTFDGASARPLIVASRTSEIDLNAQPAAPVAFGYLKDLIQTSSQAGLPYTVSYNDTNQWGPRVGFAWRPFGDRTVLRGGYGIFYEAESTSDRANLFMPPFLLEESINNDRSTIPRRTMADFFLGAPLGSPNSVIGLTPAYVRLKMGSDQHWNFGIQHQFARNSAVEIQYVANKGSNIAGRNPFNLPDAGPGAIQSRRPYPRFTGFSYISSDDSSTYHALQMKYEKRLSDGFWVLTSYTYSKSLWTANTPAVGGRFAYERGPSYFHVPHSITFSAGYELPFGRGRRMLSQAGRVANGFIGGWQLQGIFLYRSGIPFTPTLQRDVANTGVGGQRPNRTRDGHLDNPTLDRWFDVAAFVEPANFTYGNSGLRILYPDSVKTYDFSLFKNFSVTEGSKLQFRAEAFNLPNTPSFAAPNSTIGASAAGRVTSTVSSPRRIQMALKYIF
jgi:hypothetical protein